MDATPLHTRHLLYTASGNKFPVKMYTSHSKSKKIIPLCQLSTTVNKLWCRLLARKRLFCL